MNIGLLSFEYPPETGFGGIGTYTWYQARALAGLGHEVHVIAGLRQQSPLCTREQEILTVHRYRPDGWMMRAFAGLGRGKYWWTQQRLENGWSMYRALKLLQLHYRFDLLEMPECGAEGLLINSRIEVPTIVRFHSPSRLIMPFYEVRQGDVSMCSWLEQRAIVRATARSSCSHFLAGEVRDKMRVDAPVTVIPNGIDLELFDRQGSVNVAEKYGLPKDKVTIFFAGRMERRKGIHLCGTIAASILRDYDVAFVFAGEDLFGYMSDTLMPELKNQTLKGSFHYLGKLDMAEVRALVQNSDIFLLPSLWENCPYSCLEAMAASRAIVASDQGGIPELIEDGVNGLLAKSDDAASFIEQLRKLVEDRALRCRLGSAARRTIEQRLTAGHIARLSQDFYREVVDRWRSERAVNR